MNCNLGMGGVSKTAATLLWRRTCRLDDVLEQRLPGSL
jgi:hypothetical protein